MARKEARIGVTIWEDRDFLALTAIEQRWYFFLISQKDLTHAGTIPLRERRWRKSSSTTDANELETALRGLEAARFLVIDWDTEEVLVRSLMRRDKVYLQPNVMLAAVDAVGPIASPAIITALLAEVERIAAEDLTDAQRTSVNKMKHALLKRVDELGIDQPGKGSGNPSANPSPKTSENLPGERGEPLRVSNDSPFPESPLVPPPADAAAPPSRALAIVDDPGPEPRTAQELVAWWIDGCDKRPDRNTIGQISKHIKALLEQDFEPVHIRRGIAELMAKELHPSQLPNLVSHAANRGAPIRAAPGKPTRTEATFAANQQVAQRFRAIEGRGT